VFFCKKEKRCCRRNFSTIGVMLYDVTTDKRTSRIENKLLSPQMKKKRTIRKRLKEIAIQQKEALKDCPFAH
jgi:hypothetical protein